MKWIRYSYILLFSFLVFGVRDIIASPGMGAWALDPYIFIAVFIAIPLVFCEYIITFDNILKKNLPVEHGFLFRSLLLVLPLSVPIILWRQVIRIYLLLIGL
jgi:hypothetical protein